MLTIDYKFLINLKLKFKRFVIYWNFHITHIFCYPDIKIQTIHRVSLRGFRVKIFNVTFNNIAAISWRLFCWWDKPEYPEKTNDLSRYSKVK